ncbi:MAG: glycosyltransferase [Promethearchaeota archaeon]
MKILYLCHKKYYLHKMSRVRFHSMKAINKIADVKWWGIGWNGYNNNLTVQQNIENLGISPDLVIAYKPLEMKNFKDIPFPKCLRYNEMFDKEWTIREIKKSGANVVICHHKNEMYFYKNYFKENVKFFHIPHCAEKTIFKDYELPKIIDLLLVGKIDRYYPLRQRFIKLLKKKKLNKKYKCEIYYHPGYKLNKAYNDNHIIDFAKTINSSKITLTCSSVLKYRLSKYVEIPMCGSALAADLPDQDYNEFKEFMIVLDNKMKDKEIIEKLIYYLEHDDVREKLIKKGLEWSKNYTQEKYAEKFLKIIKHFLNNS